MAKLWVRMQHQGPAANKEQREKERAVSRVVLQLWTASLHGCGCEQERAELKVVVGGNLHRLASLEGVTLQVCEVDLGAGACGAAHTRR